MSIKEKEKHPLDEAIKLKNKAVKLKADKKIIQNLERIVSERAQRGADAIDRLSMIVGMEELKSLDN